jgi:hypothetical protein
MQRPVLIAQGVVDHAGLLRPDESILLELPRPGKRRDHARAFTEAALRFREQRVVEILRSWIVVLRDPALNRNWVQQLMHRNALAGRDGSRHAG